MHTCNTRHCCNPAHLKVGTQKENLQYARECGHLDNRQKSLSCRSTLKGTGVQYDRRSDNYAIMFKVFGRPLYVGMCKDQTLAYTLGKAALEEAEKLLRTRSSVTYEDIKAHFYA